MLLSPPLPRLRTTGQRASNGNYELIEELCSVARLQADIIQKQAEAIAQAEIAESVAADLAEMRKQAADTLARCEKEL